MRISVTSVLSRRFAAGFTPSATQADRAAAMGQVCVAGGTSLTPATAVTSMGAGAPQPPCSPIGSAGL